eukprot:TRINITY_DN4408_c1_g1_i1.p1 TRINITY_DN4408_c1_g1~~TRINITY_DN4408_c1_g1_i1.p1  ORF type:complete len:678 (+),score=222.24 TRINITY_DN4408_c1_g1_i1:164-2197(+)
MNKVKLLLYALGLGHKASRFDELEIDNTETLEALSEADLKEVMGGDERELRVLQRGMAKEGWKTAFANTAAAEAAAADLNASAGSVGSSALPSPAAGGAASPGEDLGASNGSSSARLSPAMVRYNQLLRKRGALLKGGASERDLQWVERELGQVRRELGVDGDAEAVALVRGDKVRIHPYNGCSKEMADLAGKVAVVVEPPQEAYHAAKVRLTQTNETMMLPVHCLRHVAESKFAKSRVRPAWGVGDAAAAAGKKGYASNRPDMVRRAVQKERNKRADPFTVHGHRTTIDTAAARGEKQAGSTIQVACVLRPEISQDHLMTLLASRLWVDRGVVVSSIAYARMTHSLAWDMAHDGRTEMWLSAEIDPYCNTRSVVRQNPCMSPRGGAAGAPPPAATPSAAETPTAAPSPHPHNIPTAHGAAPSSPPKQRGKKAAGRKPARQAPQRPAWARQQAADVTPPETPDTSAAQVPPGAKPPAHGTPGANPFLNADNLRRARGDGRGPEGYAQSMASESPSEAQFTTHSTTKKGAALEDELRLKLSQAGSRIRVFQNEIANYKLREKKLTRKVDTLQKAADRRDREASVMREKNGELVSELHKLSTALDTIMATLSQSGGQWAEQLQACGDATAARMSRGVISEVLATNHEISEKLRHINHIVRIAETDTSSVGTTATRRDER